MEDVKKSSVLSFGIDAILSRGSSQEITDTSSCSDDLSFRSCSVSPPAVAGGEELLQLSQLSPLLQLQLGHQLLLQRLYQPPPELPKLGCSLKKLKADRRPRTSLHNLTAGQAGREVPGEELPLSPGEAGGGPQPRPHRHAGQDLVPEQAGQGQEVSRGGDLPEAEARGGGEAGGGAWAFPRAAPSSSLPPPCLLLNSSQSELTLRP